MVINGRNSFQERLRNSVSNTRSTSKSPSCSTLSCDPGQNHAVRREHSHQLLARSMDLDLLPISLARSKVERWSANERIKELEDHLSDRDEIICLNAQLRQRLQDSQDELHTARDRFSSLEKQLIGTVESERAASGIMRDQLAQANQLVQSLGLERDRQARELAQSERERATLIAEIDRMNEAAMMGINRSVHERIIKDMNVELNTMKQLLNDSVPRAVHARLEVQLNEVRSELADRSEQLEHALSDISKSQTECRTLQIGIDELKVTLSSVEEERILLKRTMKELQDDLKSARALAEEGRKYRMTADTLKESVRRSTELAIENDKRKEREHEIISELSDLRQREKFNICQLRRIMRELETVKSECSEVRSILTEERSRFHSEIAYCLAAIGEYCESEMSRLISGIWELFLQMGFVNIDCEKPNGPAVLLAKLRTALVSVMAEIENAATESGELQTELVRRELELRDLRGLVASMERAKIDEKRALSKLRNSLEAAEMKVMIRNPLTPRASN